MPRFEPFRAIRYTEGTNLDAVIAPPYDVLSDADITTLAARDGHNITHIDVPGEGGYHRAGGLLQEWLKAGVLVIDDEPTLTIYRMQFTDAAGRERAISGVLGGLEVVDEGAGGVLPHERTTPKAKSDRLDLMRATGAQTSPVWGLSLAHGLTDSLAQPGELVGSVTADGVRHSVEKLTDPNRIAEIQAIVARDDVLIADGHHRYAVSRIFRDEQRAATGRTDTPAEFTLTFINELVNHQLSIEAIHRIYTQVSADQLASDLGAFFTIEAMDAEPTPATLAEMVERSRLVLVAPQAGGTTSFWLSPKSGAFDGVRNLDGAWLEHALSHSHSHAQVGYQHGLPETLHAVTSGEAQAAVLIRPTSLAEITKTAREGVLMPPKSTFFTPKLRTGLVIRPAVHA